MSRDAVRNAVSAAVVRPYWSPTQHSFRKLMVALRGAFYHDRSSLFWARHRSRVEFLKYAEVRDEESIRQLVGVTFEVADFIREHMQVSVERIIRHNETLMELPVREAKQFRNEYYRREREHDSWCKQKIKAILSRRPSAPYPYT